MASQSAGFHEPPSSLSERTQDLHRALVSLQEELEAVDWYQQRADAALDPELRRILEHNRDEEKEHASMLLEWIRRADVAFARNIKTYIGTSRPVTAIEEKDAEREGGAR